MKPSAILNIPVLYSYVFSYKFYTSHFHHLHHRKNPLPFQYLRSSLVKVVEVGKHASNLKDYSVLI